MEDDRYLPTMLSPKSVLITGSNRGIGLEFVRQFLKFADPPKYIFASCRLPEKASELTEIAKTSPCVHVIKLDVADHSSIKNAKAVVASVVEDNGINLLINNAGTYRADADIYNVSWEEMRRNFDVNAIGPLMISQAAGRKKDEVMSCNKAAIINISSDFGSITENFGRLYPYRASKAAQNMITSCLSIDLKADGILCTAVHPGWVKTDMGGPNAKISTEESVSGVFAILRKLQGEEESGKYYDSTSGKVFGW
ncbi:C-factor-like isoform X2 [Mercenaria mercenaria]|uniref:C-factor-like isoform X2 n=1 Tax=Mercenaria mercenaria TaxID=6596 RepID=UPI001E1DB776|nr:C-factor-like isoform X2 [Mercenaria mercenaria]